MIRPHVEQLKLHLPTTCANNINGNAISSNVNSFILLSLQKIGRYIATAIKAP